MKTKPSYPTQLQYSIGPDLDLKPFYCCEYLKNFDSIFCYDLTETISYYGNNLGLRIFNIVFQPLYKPGWYKIRVQSNSNRILSFSNEYQRYPMFDVGLTKSNSNLLERYMDSLYKKIEKYNIPDFKKVVVHPHDNSNLDDFYKKLNLAMTNVKLSEYSRDYKYLKSYKEMVKYVLPKMNKLSNCNGYIDYNIFVWIPKMTKSKE